MPSVVSNGESCEGDSLKVFIEQQCRRLELSVNAQIQAALPAAALYFLQCQEAHQQGHGMPSEMSSAYLAEMNRGCHVRINGESATSPASIAKQYGSQFQNGQAGKSPQSLSVASMSKSESESENPREKSTSCDLMTERSFSKRTDDTEQDRILSAKEHAMWEMRELQNGDLSNSWYQQAIQRNMEEKSLVQKILETVGLVKYLPETCPENMFVPIVESRFFQTTALVAILANACFNLYVADGGTRRVLAPEPEPLPEWWDTAEIGFVVFFTAEILVRLLAYRMWFFVCPGHWKTNVFDFSLVASSIVTSLMSTIDLLVFRCLRIFRVVRVARVVRLVHAFTELRKLLFAVLACMASLFWAVLFLGVICTLFSLMIMQGVKSEVPKYYDNDELMTSIREQFNGIGRCFKTLLTIVGGEEWLLPHAPLSELGIIYAAVMPVFVLFVQVGIMNIVIGVFAEAASRMVDRDLVARDQMGDLDDFVEAMVSLYREFVPIGGKSIDMKAFLQYFDREEVQAFLAAHHLDVSHVRLIFELVDEDKNGDIDLKEFVLALLKYKGEAKGLDLKIMLHSLTALGQELGVVRQKVKQIALQNEKLAFLMRDGRNVQDVDTLIANGSHLCVSDGSTTLEKRNVCDATALKRMVISI